MPTYVYRDPVTGDTRELFHRMSESPVVVNEATGNRMERVISGGAGFIFKGDGFYSTDYRSANYKSGEKADAPAPAPGSDSTASSGCSGGDGCGACAAA
jgi:predicted nucleic acid-binding Zn ribbon protein